jgi:hypothetical protein
MAEHYLKDVEAAKDLQAFLSSTGIKDLIRRGQDADVRFEAVSSATRDGQSDMLVFKYSYSPADNADRGFLWLHINRRYDDATKNHQWEIGGIQNSPPIGTE